jgi:hypothetical protein
MIEEIPTYTANPALRNSVLPRTSECSPNRLAAHCLHGRDNIGTELRVPIKDQEPMELIAKNGEDPAEQMSNIRES